MKYKNKSTGEMVEAIQVEDNIKSIKEALRFIGKEVPEDKELFNVGFAAYCGILSMNGIKIEPCKVAHIGDYIVRHNDGSLHVFQENEFKRLYESMDMFIKMSVNMDEYIELLEEGRRAAEKLKDIINRLNHPNIESNMESRLSMKTTIKPGKEEEYINGR